MLSFDFEEFDVPLEHGADIPMEQRMRISRQGAVRVLDCLKRQGIRATFFCTTNFATLAPDIMRRIVDEGHEVASHGCDHSQPKENDARESKEVLEQLTGCVVRGYRQPRMFPVSDAILKEAGYEYNSSLNPTFLPGRYMHFSDSRTPFSSNQLVQIPASVTPHLRIPLFWLSLHHLPLRFYQALVRRVLRHDGILVTYFHPWEFADDTTSPQYKLPFVVRRHCGLPMLQRLERLMVYLKEQQGAQFVTFTEYLTQNNMTR